MISLRITVEAGLVAHAHEPAKLLMATTPSTCTLTFAIATANIMMDRPPPNDPGAGKCKGTQNQQ
jgi:hypothetical protein